MMNRDLLPARFEQLVIAEKAYLEPHLTLRSLAARLYSNKTYISRLVNDRYGMPFPDLISQLRVEFARQYLADHPDAHQDEVARASGFASATTFNSVFTKVTGVTPKRWTATCR